MIMAAGKAFSIIIPTYNRKGQIIKALNELSVQNYDPGLFEVVVIDDGSTDGTSEELLAFKKELKIDINLIRQKNKGPAYARNVGIKNSKYEFIVFLDSDCYPLEKDWILKINEKVNDIIARGHTDFLLGGRLITPSDTLSQKFIIALDGYGTPDLGEIGFESKNDFVSFPTTNLVVPKRTFENIGGFDTNIIFGSGEDTDFCYRLWKSGNAIFLYEPSFPVFHLHRTGFRDLLNISFRRSINHHTLMAKYGVMDKHFFRRRLIKIIAIYCVTVALLITLFLDVRLAGILLLAGYVVLVLVFLLKTKSSLNSFYFPIYYVLLSIYEVIGSTIGMIIYLKSRFTQL
jgi:glycosyltransferase involved in cell wall biosynthesis